MNIIVNFCLQKEADVKLKRKMKRIFVMLMVLIGIGSRTFGQNAVYNVYKSDRENAALKGIVKKIITNHGDTTEYDIAGNLMRISSDEYNITIQYKLDANGKKMEKYTCENYYSFDDFPSFVTRERDVYLYNETENIEKEMNYAIDGNNEESIWSYYLFNDQGNPIEHHSGGTYIYYEYDSNGYLIVKTEYSSKKKLYRKQLFEYDSNGRLYKECEYDENEELIGQKFFYLDQHISEYFSRRTQSWKRDVRTYTYDSYGNWIKENRTDKPDFVLERSIEYY